MKAAPGSLYLVPNTLDVGVAEPAVPIEDVLPMAVLRTAARLTDWVAENAKTTRAFLKRVNAVVPLHEALQSINIVELPRPQKGARQAPSIDWQTFLAPAIGGRDIGLISEAGLPAVADPGASLVQAAHAAGIAVVSLPGPSALLLALAASGLNGQSFAFVGYLPVDSNARSARIRELEALSSRIGQTQLMIETPYRNAALLDALIAHLQPSTRLAVSCGLTLARAHSRTDAVWQWKAASMQLPNDIPAVFSLLAD